MDEYERKPKDILLSQPPTQPAQRSRDLPPTKLRSQLERRLSPNMRAPRELSFYSARSWWQYKTFMSQLQDHFDKHGYHCKESRKIEISRANLSRALLEKWVEYASRLKSVTWFAFCVFLVYQIPSGGAGNFKYSNTYRRSNQSVYAFALELLRWAPDNFGAKHNHIWDRILSELRSRAHKTWKDFDEFHVFVAYLQQVQDSF
ncbi:hypothetical protein PMG11_11219 [Penicillium brasilianum]|uniref:Uncharacterized protein n=1 Tax=Penicillium brasilianum TaxID=104259 RepID=A0A0F7U1I1_PENBI|nr:hypothetical protein PMG11_11219 [Penicillium brasilianum]